MFDGGRSGVGYLDAMLLCGGVEIWGIEQDGWERHGLWLGFCGVGIHFFFFGFFFWFWLGVVGGIGLGGGRKGQVMDFGGRRMD